MVRTLTCDHTVEDDNAILRIRLSPFRLSEARVETSDRSLDRIRIPFSDRPAPARARSAEPAKPRTALYHPRAGTHCVVSTAKTTACPTTTARSRKEAGAFGEAAHCPSTSSADVRGYDREGPWQVCLENQERQYVFA